MPPRSWAEMRESIAAMLVRDTGHHVGWWNDQMATQPSVTDETTLRARLREHALGPVAADKLTANIPRTRFSVLLLDFRSRLVALPPWRRRRRAGSRPRGRCSAASAR